MTEHEATLAFAHYVHDKNIILFGGGPISDIPPNYHLLISVNGHGLKPEIRKHGESNIIYANGLTAMHDLCKSDLAPSWVLTAYPMNWRTPMPNEQQFRDWTVTHNIQRRRFSVVTYDRPSPIGPELEWCNMLGKQLGTMPLAGILAVADLTRFSIRALYITGMSFYLTNDVLPYRVYAHSIAPQIDWLRQQLNYNKRIHVDAQLRDILNGRYRMQRTSSVITPHGPVISIDEHIDRPGCL